MNNNIINIFFLRKSINILSIFFLYFIGSINAQDNYFSNQQFIQKDGLSQVTINEMIQDDLGFVWIATDNGLNRFDGSTFKVFHTDKNDSTTVSGLLINTLYESQKGQIWIGSSDGGLSYYEPNLNYFQKINLINNVEESISSIVGDKKDNIWVGTKDEGLFKISMDNDGTFIKNQYFSNASISKLYFDGKYLWIGDYQGQVYQSQYKNGKFEILNQFKIDGQIRSFLKTKKGLLIGTNSGLYNYSYHDNNCLGLKLQGSSIALKFISHLSTKNQDNIWIATGDGLYLLNLTNNKIVGTYRNNQANAELLSNNTILSLLKLKDKTLCVGSANGLNLLSFIPPFFKNISKGLSTSRIINDNVVFAIYKDNEDLWVGTSEGGLNYLKGDKLYTFKGSKNKNTPISGTIRSIVKDELNNRLWLATSRGLNMIDLNTFDPDNPKVLLFKNEPNDPNSMPFNYIKDLAIDQNNNIWAATYGQGVFRMETTNLNQVKYYHYTHQNKDTPISNNFTSCISIDHENNIWIGSEAGLSKISFEDNDYDKFKIENINNQNSGINNYVYDIYVTEENKIWIATRKGVNKLEGQKFKKWPIQTQYDQPITYLIQEDNEGNMWLGTNDGLIHLNTKTDKFSKYTTDDGLKHNEFDTHARFKDDNGEIYLGGLGGVIYFHPKEHTEMNKISQLYFSALRIKDKTTSPKVLNQNLFDRTGNYTKDKLTFNQDEFPFYLKFSSLDFSENKNTDFSYRILPLSNEWNTLKNSEIQFLNLSSGDYKLQVTGFSRGSKWKQEPLEVDFKVLSPWWNTWWAYIWYVSFISFLIYRYYKFKLSSKLALAESTKLKEIGLLKNQLYTNITHEFRTPLTVIQGMVQVLENNLGEEKSTGVESSIQLIKRNGEKLLLLVNEMLDLAKLENGTMLLNLQQSDIVAFLKYLSDSYSLMANEKGIKIMVYSEIDRLNMDFDPKRMTSIISNLLTNAIKFSKEKGRVVVHLNKTSKNNINYLTIKIQDNGAGIEKDKIQYIFNRYYRNENVENTGSGIGLTLTKEIVKLMSGHIAVTSELGKGSTFILDIPITNLAAKQVNTKPLEHSVPVSNTFIPDIPDEYQKEYQPLILIIEDNEDVAYYIESCLKKDYKVIHAINGELGIQKAIENVPDIIISDVMMPKKDGFEVCTELKTNEVTDHIPIILLTAKATTRDKIEGLSRGADAYLAKPFVKEELLTRIEKLISFRQKMINKFKNDDLNKYIIKPNKSVETKFLKKAIEAIYNNVSDENFGPSELASLLLLSDSQLYRKLKSLTEKSTSVFIRSIRLQRAKELLTTSKKSIAEIAYEIGFNDPSWFSRIFKEEFGMAPSSIRKQTKN